MDPVEARLRAAIELCVLFGSRATGRARVDSDWDVAIWASPPTPETRLRWLADLQEVFGGTVQPAVRLPGSGDRAILPRIMIIIPSLRGPS